MSRRKERVSGMIPCLLYLSYFVFKINPNSRVQVCLLHLPCYERELALEVVFELAQSLHVKVDLIF